MERTRFYGYVGAYREPCICNFKYKIMNVIICYLLERKI